jgi:folate-binding protein YgfZ
LTTGRLAEYRAVVVEGDDAARFLQGQLTQDVGRLRGDATVLAGWADPKGRLQWVGHAWSLPGDAVALLVPAALADDLVAGLGRYVLRAKARLRADALVVGTVSAGDHAPAGSSALRLAGDAGRQLWWAPPGTPALPAQACDAAALELADIRAGLPVVVPATRGEFVPQMVNLDLLDGISFSKGCYPGQEIVARTRYLGRVKRRMLRFATAGAAPPPGMALAGPAGPAGQVVRAAHAGTGAELLAVVMLEALPGPLALADGTPLAPLPLPYAVPELAG